MSTSAGTMLVPTYKATQTAPSVKPAGIYGRIKRAMDIAVAGTALLLLSPALPVLAAAIRLDSRGPLFYSQPRVTKGGRHFRCWKFRSMYTDADARRAELDEVNEMEEGVTFKMRHDPRITRIGRFIRKASIDELPQLWNVLVGDMTLVGPRPPLPTEVAQYTAYQRQRLAVTGGITCLWQVGGRSDLDFDQQVALDLEYIEKRSAWLDIVILARTIPAVLTARGAY